MNVGGLPWDVFVAMTCRQLSNEIGEDIVHDVDVLLTVDPNDQIRYTALTEKGGRALSVAFVKMKKHEEES